nr:immunoglobulin heavy chain junction region [Macaca mulatta]
CARDGPVSLGYCSGGVCEYYYALDSW